MKKITLLGVEGCPTCARLDAKVQEAVAALAAPVEVEKIADPAKIMEINAGGLPAVLVDGEVKALRRVPEVKELVEWLQ
ncbi:MAG: thioredoxin family protein [Bacillota bacterium]|jgi:hypothetical protein